MNLHKNPQYTTQYTRHPPSVTAKSRHYRGEVV